jgi:quercetin dioxygenase-like cupin family protein
MRLRTLIPVLSVLAASLVAEEIKKTPIDNADIRVLDVIVQPHEKTSMHEHKANRVMIYRNAGSQAFEYENGKHGSISFKENEVKWSPIEGKHIAEVSTEKPVNIIEIELKKPGAGKTITTPLDPLKLDTKHYKLEFENDQVRVFRVHIGPHESTPMHEHQLHRISVFLTDANIRSTGADAKIDTTPHKAGDIVEGGPGKHGELNLTDKPVDVIVTELKY